jgi:tRNA/tmRNA/rRNA uracil-C5-methylase (TrmA/RlmC/RlmD family)
MSALVCPHQPSCPGCPRLATPGLPSDALGRLRALAERAGTAPPTMHPSPPTAFRRRARLAIRGRADAPKLGIFEAGTHRVVHIPRCLVHHPLVNRAAAATRDALAEHRVPTYSDAAHAGIVRYLQVVIERHTERAQLTLVTNGTTSQGLEPVFQTLQASLGAELHSLWWNGNAERTNTILGPHWQHISGPASVEDTSGDARVFYPPSAFGQSNLDLAMQLAARVRELASPGQRITEYYAGVGAIGLGLAASAAELRLNELGEGSLAGLEHGVSHLPTEQRGQVTIHRGSAAAHTELVAQSDFVIADPPRKGLDLELTNALVRQPPSRFAYVSCDVTSLERDAAALLESFTLTALEAYDLFPHTEHVETLAVFERR